MMTLLWSTLEMLSWGSAPDLLRYNLKAVRGYLLKEDFQFFGGYVSPHWAGKFLDTWCGRTMRSRIERMKKVARMLRSRRELLLNWFRAKRTISSGVMEGLNNKLKLTTRKSYGFGTFRVAEIVLYLTLGDLPEPECTHQFPSDEGFFARWQRSNQPET
jgi:transposase